MATISSTIAMHGIPANTQHPVTRMSQLYGSFPVPPARRFIRVLDLSHDSNAVNAPLRGTLRVEDLHSCPRFAALSYVWGESSRVQDTICCNGCDVPISKNCREALLSLRNLYGNITIWVDSICIDQADEDEKASQIQLMEEIYSWAEVVYVWLGAGTTRLHDAIDTLHLCSKLRLTPVGMPWTDPQGGRSVWSNRMQLVAEILHMFVRTQVPTPRGRTPQSRDIDRMSSCFDGEAIEEFLTTDWLTRIWTFQEIVLASNPVIVCRPKVIDWAALHRALDFLADCRPIMRPVVILYWLVPPGTDPKIVNSEVHLSSQYHAWRALLGTWLSVARHTHWNGKEFCRIPRADDAKKRITVSEYQKYYVKPRRVIQLTALVIVILTWVPVLALVIPGILFLRMNNPRSLATALYCLIFAVIGCAWPVIVVNNTFRDKFWRLGELDSSTNSDSSMGIVQVLRERKATEEKDKAIGLYGVLRSMGVSPSKPNYQTPVHQAYRDLFRQLVTWNPALINCLLDAGPTIPGGPSWVPNWTPQAQEKAWLHPVHVYNALEDPIIAGGTAEFTGPDQLTVRGCFLGEVTFCTTPIPRLPETKEEIEMAFGTVGEWVCAFERELNQMPRDVSHPIMRELCVQYSLAGIGGPDAGPRIPRSFEAWYECMRRLHSDRLSGLELGRAIMAGLHSKPDALEYALERFRKLAGRRLLFWSRDAARVGSAALGTTAGDKIADIDGLSVPLILRETGSGTGRYTVIGPAFVPNARIRSHHDSRWTYSDVAEEYDVPDSITEQILLV